MRGRLLSTRLMPTSRSRSPPRRRERYPDDAPRSRDYGRARRDDDRRNRRRDYDGERTRERWDRNGDRVGPPRKERSPRRKYNNDHHWGPSSRPRSPSRSRSRSKSVDKTQPNFKPSGLLAAETNTVTQSDGTSTFLKYNEPPEARRPSQGWRLYVFKGKEQVGECYRQASWARVF